MDEKLSWFGTGLTAVFTGVQMTTESMVSLILSIIVGCLTIAYTIWRWYREAKKDGTITKDEIVDLIDDIVDKTEEISDDIKNTKDKIDKNKE